MNNAMTQSKLIVNITIHSKRALNFVRPSDGNFGNIFQFRHRTIYKYSINKMDFLLNFVFDDSF